MNLQKFSLIEGQNPLSNLKIAITAVDLEQSEHRGIAHLSKSLISSLTQQGAEVYLLTGLGGERLNPFMKFFMNKISVNEVESADILDQLSDPKIINEKKMSEIDQDKDYDLFFKFSAKIIRFKSKLDKVFSVIKPILNFYLKGGTFSGKIIRLIDLKSSPYWGKERIDYLKDVKGFLSIPNIFVLSTLRSRRLLMSSPIIDLRKSNIDVLITTCPLSIEIKNKDKKNLKMLQMIMDFIPLSFSQHPDHPYYFYNRLKDSMQARCCFISQTSRDKICSLLNKSKEAYNNIIYPMPSLSINTLKAAANLTSIRGIDHKFILFNSSIVPRKNLHFLINAFRASNISEKGFKLCVAGKIHNDDYGLRIKKLCKNDCSINLLGYVEEIEKAWLFLHAHAFASPSCVEGFGIPVLDAYLLGLHVLVSNIPSHQEIASISSGNTYLRLLDLTDINSWITNLLEVADESLHNNISSQDRISRFISVLGNYQNSFDKKLYQLIMN